MSSKLGIYRTINAYLALCAVSLCVSWVHAESPTSLVLGFEDPTEWALVEGSGQVQASESATVGATALLVGGGNWRRIASTQLSTIGAAANSLKIDVAPQSLPGDWETVGIVLEIPSKGIYWQDLGTASLQGLAPGQYTTLAFPVSESLRATLNEVYNDLVIRVSINSSSAVLLDNISLSTQLRDPNLGGPDASENSELAAPSPYSNFSDLCSNTDAIQVVDIDADIAEIWSGLESPDTGKRTGRSPEIAISFSEHVSTERVSGLFRPVSCGGLPIRALSEDLGVYWRGAVQKVGDQRVPLDFGILANGWISGVVNSAGPIAARGNISLNDFSVNFASNQPFGLISNGKVHLSSGTIHGNVRFVEASSIPNTVQLVGGNTVQESAIDFMQAFRNAEYISQALAGHGVGPVDNYGNLSFVGNEEVNTFSVEAAVLREAHSITIDVPETAGAIINIIGADVAVSNLGVVLNGLAPERLLWNAQQARSFLLSSVGFSGSILAPNAMVDIRNADVKGTIVADTLISASSGLQYAPLDADLLLGVGESSRVSLRPTRQLEPGCKYELVVSSLVPLNEDLLCLEAPLVVPFWVAEKETTPASSELMDTRTDKSGNLIRLAAKDGINTPLEKVWSRYEDALDLDNDELVEVSFARPSSFFSGSQHRFGQFHQGFQVLGYGYFVQSANGGFRSARGRVIKGIGELPSWTMDFEQALDAVLQRVGYVEPWVTDPSRFERPSADLMWVSRTERALASDFELRWVIDFSKSGVKDVSSAHVLADDAARVILLSDSDHCLSSDAIPVGASTATVVTEYNGTRSIPTYEYDDDGQSRIILETPGGQPRRLGLILNTPGEEYDFVCDENGDNNWNAGDEAQVATMFWGLLEAENYLANSGFEIDGVPWTTPDTSNGVLNVKWITDAGYVPECAAAAGHSLPWS